MPPTLDPSRLADPALRPIADKVLGIYHTMDDFHGRPDKQA